ncbi:MAG: response regulator [Trueperaceae bacterium]|nr:response regulator [Trueperaceae bacterium]
MSSTASRPAEILLVEDSPADITLVEEIFEESRIPCTLHVVQDGQAAMDHLRRAPGYENAVQPDLVLLDLNLPKMGGAEVLVEIKNDPELRRIPVVVLTTSDQEADVLRSYDQHANSYIIKPIGYEQFMQVVHTLEDFWFSTVRLPSRDGPP